MKKLLNLQFPFFNINLQLGLLMFFILPPSVVAQKNTDTLQEVLIKDKKPSNSSHDIKLKEFATGQQIITLDSSLLQQYKMQQVSQLLQQQLPVFIRSYGMNSMATLNFRGSSAAQSQVVWNGVPIQNAALGMADMSLFPVSMMNQVQVLYGSSSALLGSGNVGGALLLESESPRYDTAVSIKGEASLGWGSYHQYQAAAKTQIAHKRLSVLLNGLLQQSENDFSYLKFGNKTINRNATSKGASGMLQLGYRLTEFSTLKAIAWHQTYHRQIPPALFESYSVKKREDVNTRFLVAWNRKQKAGEQYIRAAYFKEALHYQDSTVQLISNNVSHQSYLEAGWKQSFTYRHKLLVFLPAQWSQMKTTKGWKSQWKTALAAAYTYTDALERFKSSMHLRAERIDHNFILLPGIGATYQLSNYLTIRGNIQKTYRAPTLNEWYYEPGGNPNLLSEQGWAADVGYSAVWQPLPSLQITQEGNGFYRSIHNWIAWFGGAIWTPHNIATVRSVGADAQWTASYATRNFQYQLSIKGAYTSAITTQSYLPNDGSVGKQIPYTPLWLWIANASIAYKGFSLQLNQTYTGYRFYNTDETGYLPAYSLSNLQLSKIVDLKKYQVQLGGWVNNIWDVSYTIVASRPMPGRNVAVAVTLMKK